MSRDEMSAEGLADLLQALAFERHQVSLRLDSLFYTMELGRKHCAELLDEVGPVAGPLELLYCPNHDVIADSLNIDFIAPFCGGRRWW